jgi:adenine-specific DNA-methyltransferase
LTPRKPLNWNDFLADLDDRRKQLSASLDVKSKAELGQFLTPVRVARFMAGMFRDQGEDISVLDAGAGFGSLTAAFVAEMAIRSSRLKRIHATLYEVDPALADALESTIASCAVLCAASGITLEYEILREDFIRMATAGLGLPLTKPPKMNFDCAILNPPYRKINGESDTRRVLSDAGIEVNNLYSAFLALAARLLRPDGELVAITPRSFCNGPYFKAFRQDFFSRMSLDRMHVYGSRADAFRDDDVLQENLIFHAVKNHSRPAKVLISSSLGPLDSDVRLWQLPPEDVIRPRDPEMVVHVIADEAGRKASEVAERLCGDLCALGLSVSTGRVVDFRARSFLRATPNKDTAPLIYPFNLDSGRVVWPKPHARKPVAIVNEPATAELLIPSEIYVLVKRFSAKEERRRIVAALYHPEQVQCPAVGFENHLNYFHIGGRGLPLALARGLTAFLNSTLADTYFRNFNGHTQVNAQDLRRLKYPTREQLIAISEQLGEDLAGQYAVDAAVEDSLDLVAASSS